MIMTMSWIFIFMVILRSTTGPYGRPMIEVAYEKILFSLHRGCMGDDSSKIVIGVSTRCRPCWTYPDQHQCGLNVYYFPGFHTIKIDILFSKAICSIKEHWWSLTLSWPDEVQRIFSTAHEFLKRKDLNHRQFLWLFYINLLTMVSFCFISFMRC